MYVHLSVYLSACLSVLPIHLPVYLSIFPSILYAECTFALNSYAYANVYYYA